VTHSDDTFGILKVSKILLAGIIRRNGSIACIIINLQFMIASRLRVKHLRESKSRKLISEPVTYRMMMIFIGYSEHLHSWAASLCHFI
jgi:hypothetical protein